MSEFDPNIPIYLQIIHSIKQEIVAGILRPGDKLPSVREQAEALTVNPNTVQRAYQELEREGVTETRRGMGTFIVDKDSLASGLKPEMAKEIIHSCLGGLKGLGFKPTEMLEAISRELRILEEDRGNVDNT
jgi:DNA-binding transcriptional regulator YhcF (GntR family)